MASSRKKKESDSLPAKQGEGRFEPIRFIRVRGAEENNLKSVDVDIPRDVLTVITGLSGSGKSSLAFDTIFAEGQRKYMESLSAYARQFLNQLQKPKIESIDGLTPTIAIEQRAAGRNPRSTVATTTEIYDYLRLFFARVGHPTCWHPTKMKKNGEVVKRCGAPIARSNPSTITGAVARLQEGTRLMVLAPVIRTRKGYHRDVLESLAKGGYVRARVNGEIVVLEDVLSDTSENPLGLGRYELHNIEVVVDRLVVRPEGTQRLTDSVETALGVGEGVVIVSVQEDDTWNDAVYSEHYACAVHPEASLEEIEPRLFSFNSHFGACPTCQGLGEILEFDADLCLPDPKKGIGRGGIAPWKRNGPAGMFSGRFIRRFCQYFELSRETPVGELSDELRQILLFGTTTEDETKWGETWAGVIPQLTQWYQDTDSRWAREFLPQFMRSSRCSECLGARLNIKALSVFVPLDGEVSTEVIHGRDTHGLSNRRDQMNIQDFAGMSIENAEKMIQSLVLSEEERTIADPIVREIKARLGFLLSVGLGYLSLNRKTGTLSGGEAQRIRLASQVGSGIVGATYVLDEPTIGLHARDNQRLIRTLRHLSDIGNTVIVVEHDEAMIRCADHVIDLGPGPGVHGGEVVAQGRVADIEKVKSSLTGQYLSGAAFVETPTPGQRRKLKKKNAIRVLKATHHNLQNISVAFPLGGLVCVTGVSGSGKSTLVNDILLRAAERHLGKKKVQPGAHKAITGLDTVSRVIEVNQAPIGRTPRSNPATYTDMFNDIRALLAMTNDAKTRGYKPGRFSFNVKGGRCEECKGQGVRRVSMHFLPDVFVTCEACAGKRFNKETLEITYRGMNIAEMLEMTIADACDFFKNHKKVARISQCLADVGLGYLTLGQPATTLSGGEAQRVKLASELGKGPGRTGASGTLYVLDEPTTGLHFEDVRKLIGVLHRLVDNGNTVVVIEHNLDVIKSADWLIDLGPEGGNGGGTLVAEGPPEKIAAVEASFTGQFLREMLGESFQAAVGAG